MAGHFPLTQSWNSGPEGCLFAYFATCIKPSADRTPNEEFGDLWWTELEAYFKVVSSIPLEDPVDIRAHLLGRKALCLYLSSEPPKYNSDSRDVSLVTKFSLKLKGKILYLLFQHSSIYLFLYCFLFLSNLFYFSAVPSFFSFLFPLLYTRISWTSSVSM